MIANSVSIISHKSENRIVLDITISIVSEGPDYHWAALNLVYWTLVLCLFCLWVSLVWRKQQYKNSLQLVPMGGHPGYLSLFVQLTVVLITCLFQFIVD